MKSTFSSGRKEVQTSRNVNIDFSSESSALTVEKTSAGAVIASESMEKQLDSMDSTVCIDYNVKSSEEETVCAEVIHAAYGTCGSRWASTSVKTQPTTSTNNHNQHLHLNHSQPSTTLQPRPSDGTTTSLAASNKLKSRGYFATYLKGQQNISNDFEPELLEKDRSIRKSLSRLLFKKGGAARSGQKTGPTSRSSICESTTSCNSSFCSKAGAVPISRSAIAYQLLERINSREQQQQNIQDFDEDDEDEEVEEGLEEGEDGQDCNHFCNSNSSNSSSQEDSSSSPLSLRSLSLPNAYRSNFILRENSDIYTAPHLCRGQQQA